MPSIKHFIHKAVSMRIAVLPIRLVDVNSPQAPFITRSQLSRRVEDQLHEECILLSLKTGMIAVEGSRIKELTNKLTRFAILSHTWGPNEVTYQDVYAVTDSKTGRLPENAKLEGLMSRAAQYRCRYVWMDSICIDKSSSAELDESIRSMYTWYRTAYVCLVYLSRSPSEPTSSEKFPWFNRGWTLQELLAPKRIIFFNEDWGRIFDDMDGIDEKWNAHFDITRDPEFVRHDYQLLANGFDYFPHSVSIETGKPTDPEYVPPIPWIAHHTGISVEDLNSYTPKPSQARKIFTYMQNRTTTVPEDTAYCLAGLLGITLPTAYGEGADRALYRLQVACAGESDDRNIFLWDYRNNRASRFNSMLPGNPFGALIDNEHSLPGATNQVTSVVADGLWDHVPDSTALCSHIDHTFAFTNGGLRISVVMHDIINKFGNHIYCKAFPDQGVHILSSDETEFEWNTSQIKLAILGTYTAEVDGVKGTYGFPIILQKLGTSKIPKYRRIPCTISLGTLPSAEILLGRAPDTVYIV
ncbi:hypothetical protein ONZ45_g10611 [Pleurotus djamor]|nr:hypothetical protein ONZ45_g10611 [Pleurotus djamor]